MKIIFLGVGEAFDKDLPNNSHLVISDKTSLLLDCGFNIPQQLWKFNEEPDFLDAIYISHQHADHYFGLPALLLRMWEDGRKKDLTIICQKNLEDSFQDFMDYAYKGFIEKFGYKINFLKADEKEETEFNDLIISFERTIHSGENLAIRISDGKKVLCYSGDGLPLENSGFYKDIDLLIQETYLYDVEKVGHGSIVGAISFAEKNRIKCLVLTHINRNFRRDEIPNLKSKIKSDSVKIIIPNPFEEYSLE